MPTPTHIEWLGTGALLTAKKLEAGKVVKTGKMGDICYQFATKFLRITELLTAVGKRAERAGSAQILH
jgi:hypothetical protein